MKEQILARIPEEKRALVEELIAQNDGKVVLLSIRKRWLDHIASGEKTIELRKTTPQKLKMPFVALCYETMANGGAGKVVGVLCVDEILALSRDMLADAENEDVARVQRESLVAYENMLVYLGKSKHIYGWNAGDYTPIPGLTLAELGVERAPQSWQYIG